MAEVTRISSNQAELRFALEETPGVLPTTPVWIPLEPNSFSDFGATINTVARNPFSQSRQRKRGVVVGIDASSGFNMDLTQKGTQKLMECFCFANMRRKGECANDDGITTLTVSVTASSSTLTRVGGTLDLTTKFIVGSLVKVSGSAYSTNNGLFEVDAVTSSTLVLNVANGSGTLATLTDESASSSISIVTVGYQTAAGDLDVSVSSGYPTLTSSALDFTTLGLIPGEWLWIGGDASSLQFGTAANRGYARVRSVAAHVITLDKTSSTFVTEASTTKLVQIFFGNRILKNETGSSVVTKTIQLERTLGKPNPVAAPSGIQSEYMVGAFANQVDLNLGTQSIGTADFSFICMDNEQRTATTGVKSGTRPTLVESNAFNTSSNIGRFKMSLVSASDAAPTPLFTFATDGTISINNNVQADTAIGVVGAIGASEGMFAVSGSLTVYFADIAAIQAVRNNSNVTVDWHMYSENSGISYDLPLVTLGDGKMNLEQNRPMTLPITFEAASGSTISSSLDHTIMIVFWDYLPSLADPNA